MKRTLLLSACLSAVLGISAQTWKLNEMPDEAFAQGGDHQWAFEKYTYETGAFTYFETFEEFSTCNYVDIYQPERVGGQLFQDIDKDMVINGEFTWAQTKRKAWYDTEWTTPSRTDANAKFVYVARADMLDNIFEVCGNQQYTAVVSFVVPDDGFYAVDGTVIRQDGANLKALHLIPRFRIKGAKELSPKNGIMFDFPFGEGGEMIEGVTDNKLVDGYAQRYTPQQPTAFDFAFAAKAGDVVSFEVNYDEFSTSAWPRDYYPRTFYRQLDVRQVDEATATASEHFYNPYDGSAAEEVTARIEYYEAFLAEMEFGTEPGMYAQSAYDEFAALCGAIYSAIDDGTLNATNVAGYIEQLDATWQRLEASAIVIDFGAIGNERLFYSTGSLQDGDLEVHNQPEVMAENTNNPWGFYARVVANGTFEQLVNHDTNNMSKESAWYRGANQWFYITDGGSMHPMTDRAPGIMFTALEDGIYRLDLSLYRPNPNANVENPLYVRWFHLYDGAETAATDQAVLSEQYGSVAGDGEGGKKPINMTLYASLKAGDRLFFEIDCYTSGRNSSAGTQILSLSACRNISDTEPITAAMAEASGELFLSPYTTGDCTLLRATIAEAEQLLATTEVGDAQGQYPAAAAETLQQVLAEAKANVVKEGDPNLTQSVVDAMNRSLQEAIGAYQLARIPFTLQPSGEYAFATQKDGVEKYITRNNQGSGQYYYANVFDMTGVEADMERLGVGVESFIWNFTVAPVEGTNEVTITTADGYMTPDGYIKMYEETYDENGNPVAPVLPTFRLVKANADEELFAIQRVSDGLYFGNYFNWASPYNKIATSATPQFIWYLVSGMDNPVGVNQVVATAKAVRSEYFDLAGRRVSSAQPGIVIRRTTYADGTVRSEKVLK